MATVLTAARPHTKPTNQHLPGRWGCLGSLGSCSTRVEQPIEMLASRELHAEYRIRIWEVRGERGAYCDVVFEPGIAGVGIRRRYCPDMGRIDKSIDYA